MIKKGKTPWKINTFSRINVTRRKKNNSLGGISLANKGLGLGSLSNLFEVEARVIWANHNYSAIMVLFHYTLIFPALTNKIKDIKLYIIRF